MSTSDPPAVARRRVRLALREAREARGLTQGQVAKAMDWSLSKIMRIEKGEVSIQPADLRVLLNFLGITDRDEIERLTQDARAARRERWTVDPQLREHLTPASLELMQLELEATAIRYFASVVIPGPLQIPEYTEAIFSFSWDLDESTIQTRMQARRSRSAKLFSRASRPEFLVILDQSVLYRELGDRAMFVRQLRELLEHIERRTAVVRVLPYSAGAVALIGPFSILDFSDGQNPVLYRERHSDDELVVARRELEWHRDKFQKIWDGSLSESDSVALINKRLAEMTTQ